MTLVVKLGGSVLTRKDEPETVDPARLERAARTVAAHVAPMDAGPSLLLVHGGGSFGHYHADRHDISPSSGSRDAVAVREIHGAMTRLNGMVIDALADYDVPALPIRPLSAAVRDREGRLHLPIRPIQTMLAEGFLPVVHGDVIVHAGNGATILSGDEIVVDLAEALGADRVGLCTSVPGVLDEDGTPIERIETFDEVGEVIADPDVDVTGGMAGKVRSLLALDGPASIFDLDGLEDFLDGGDPGTLIESAEGTASGGSRSG